MIEALDELHVALQELVSTASGVPLSRVILADQGRPPPDPPDELYATYNPIPVRAYGQPRKDRELTPAEETGPTQNWEDLAETTVTQLDLMLSVNFLNENARDAAMKMQNANFRVPVHAILWNNGIGWRNASEVRRLTELTQGGLQPRYQTDVDLFIETSITDTVLAAAGFSFEIEDNSGNTVATGG